jgi:hypothetical protein
MPSFSDNLARLAHVDGYLQMDLLDENSAKQAVIENRPGSQGSFRVYYHVAQKWDGIGPAAAREALELFAEHTEDARQNPGKHPNIDRLFRVIEQGIHYSVRCSQEVAG